jgi:DNA-3-methyladenine glycosylase II
VSRGTLVLAGPLDLPASVERFRRWGDDLVERWDGRRLLLGGPTPVLIEVLGRDRVRVQGPGAADVPAMFVQEPLADLAAVDPVIAAIDRRHPGLRPVLTLDPLTALLAAISAQQVNLRWACTTRRRLVEAYGTPTTIAGEEVWSHHAGRLAAAGVADIRALQFTSAKAAAIVDVARAAADGQLERTALDALEDGAVLERLMARRGVGRWTAEWFLARTLGRPVVVAGDLGVRKAVGLAYLEGRMPSEEEVRAVTAHWGSAAGVAQQLMLHALGEGDLTGGSRLASPPVRPQPAARRPPSARPAPPRAAAPGRGRS